MKCRFCDNKLSQQFVDLENSPPSNSFLTEKQLNEPEVFYPLKLYVCEKCWLVQVAEYKRFEEIFNQEYIYFSSYSQSWLDHSKSYVEMIINRLGLNESSKVIEIASNDGYLLQYFKQKNIPCLGIEPAENTAQAARAKGIEVLSRFFTKELAGQLANQGPKPNLIIGNNVLAHVPDINDFVKGLKIALKPGGVITMEFPHLMRLVENKQFDTIYHEHFSYISFNVARKIFKAHGLELFDVDEVSTHGGSLRIYAQHADAKTWPVSENVERLLETEEKKGMLSVPYYQSLQECVDKVKSYLISFLIEQKRTYKTVAGYGAAAKGNTLLNYCGVRRDMIPFVVDASPHKQGKFMPGSHIPVVDESKIKQEKPDYVLILPWNLMKEITSQLKYIQNWGGKFVVAIPSLEVL